MGVRDRGNKIAFAKKKKEPVPWSIEVGRVGAQGPIDDWVGKVTGVRIDGSTWERTMGKNGKDAKVNDVLYQVDDNWMIAIRYGTQIMYSAQMDEVKDIDEAVNLAKEVYKEIGNKEWDDDIRTGKGQMDKDRAEGRKKAEAKKAAEAA